MMGQARMFPVSLMLTIAQLLEAEGYELEDSIGVEPLAYGWRVFVLVGDKEFAYYLIENDKVDIDALDVEPMMVTPFSNTDDESRVYWVFDTEPMAHHLAN